MGEVAFKNVRRKSPRKRRGAAGLPAGHHLDPARLVDELDHRAVRGVRNRHEGLDPVVHHSPMWKSPPHS